MKFRKQVSVVQASHWPEVGAGGSVHRPFWTSGSFVHGALCCTPAVPLETSMGGEGSTSRWAG